MSCGKRWYRELFVAMALTVCVPFATAQQSAIDLEGRSVNPFTASGGKVVVLVFLRRDCPISGRYAPVIQRISRQYLDKASFWLVYPGTSETAQAIRKSVSDYGYDLPVLRDPERVLVKLGRVRITPEVAVFDRNRRLIYDGRIDDWYIDSGRARPAATTHELEDAVRAAATGERVPNSEVRGVGCYISDLE
jgi:hypothetical protein